MWPCACSGAGTEGWSDLNRAEARAHAREELRRRAVHWELARRDPLYLVSHMSAVDEGDGSRFSFEHVRWPLKPGEVVMRSPIDMGAQDTWRWQRLAGEKMLRSKRFMALKGRQIGITWLWLGVDCAEAILMPGSSSAIYRQKESDAIDSVRRWWILYQSLPGFWKDGIEVVTPDRGVEPGREGVRLKFADGLISRVIPMTSAQSSGHGKTLRRALADEAAHIEALASIKKAVEPAAAQGVAKIGYISTANGRSNPETGEGNRFHFDWVSASDNITRVFFPYDVHPNRDQHWYDTVPRLTLGLTEQEVNEQYPRNEHEAFALTQHTFVPPEVLSRYQKLVEPPKRRLLVEKRGARKAAFVERSDGPWQVWRDPEEGHSYAIGVDAASTRGIDFTGCVVVDLTDMAVVCQYNRKTDADLVAHDLHYIGRWYNTATLAIENTGGFGDAVIIPLRDGRAGRPAYPKLYRHELSSRPDLPTAKPYGFPTNTKTRPHILTQVQKALREGSVPWMTAELQAQLENFLNFETGTSPRAAEGHHDDLVMAFAIALEVYRRKGHHPERRARKATRRWRNLVPLHD